MPASKFLPPSPNWEPFEVNDLGDHDVAWADVSMKLDCICNPNTPYTPGWDKMPYDIEFPDPESRDPQPCARCGRLYKLEIVARVTVYTPLAIRYPKKDTP